MAICGVYFIECGRFIKIGVSGDVTARLADLQRSNPQELVGLGAIQLPSGQALQLERLLHRHFAAQRHRFEWFHDHERIRDYIEEHARPLGGSYEACRDCRSRHAPETLRACQAPCPLAGLRPAADSQDDSRGLTGGLSRRAGMARAD
jgi:hypothetical protein